MEWTNWESVPGVEFKQIIYERKYRNEGGGVIRITFNRPERYNSLTDITVNEIHAAFDEASHDDGIGVIVVTGAGEKAFCAGGDVEWEGTGGLGKIFRRQPNPPNMALRKCRKPVIAAVKGYCIGAGNHFAYMCDFTIAAENAIFGQNGPRVGSPADGYLVAYLTRVVGAKKAREIWMLCRKYKAQEALEMGLINAVVPVNQLDEEVDKWCNEILSLSPGCIEILKASFDMDIDYMDGSFGKISGSMYPEWFDGHEFKEGPQAFVEKRAPNFWDKRKIKT